MNNNVTTRVCVTLLIELINSSKHGSHIFKQLGISKSTMKHLSQMNVSEIHYLAEVPFVQFDINNRTLNLSVQRILDGRSSDNLINRAIELGASRAIMKVYANLTHKRFNELRSQIDINHIRSRPQSLNDKEYRKLADLHTKYGQSHTFTSKLDHLRCLVFLSEKTNLEINRVFEYFYEENQGIFLTEKYTAGV